MQDNGNDVKGLPFNIREVKLFMVQSLYEKTAKQPKGYQSLLPLIKLNCFFLVTDVKITKCTGISLILQNFKQKDLAMFYII